MSEGSIVLISKSAALIGAGFVDGVVVVTGVVVVVVFAALQSSPLISQSSLTLPQSKLFVSVKSE